MSKRKKGRYSPDSRTRKVTGVWQECIACGGHLPCDPDLGMCGACTYGEASELMAFEGEYEVTTYGHCNPFDAD